MYVSCLRGSMQRISINYISVDIIPALHALREYSLTRDGQKYRYIIYSDRIIRSWRGYSIRSFCDSFIYGVNSTLLPDDYDSVGRCANVYLIKYSNDVAQSITHDDPILRKLIRIRKSQFTPELRRQLNI